MKPFSLIPAPVAHFGVGKFIILPSIIKQFGSKALLVMGAKSFTSTDTHHALLLELHKQAITFQIHHVNAEPTPTLVDDIVKKSSGFGPDVVIAIGGGSSLDAGKAISAMLPLNEPVKDYLEGVGSKIHPGSKIPFIAVPTTSGTGSEAARNAVLSETGIQGYKRSLRHTNFVPNIAIIDPALSISCPRTVTAASGLDAFTQLLESYLSTSGNRITDALAWEGLQHVPLLAEAYRNGDNIIARTGMALAAYLSGITLTNAGLGVVHGFAAAIGGLFEIPHGVICSTLMFSCNKITLRKLRLSGSNAGALKKYANVGKLFCDDKSRADDYYVDFLVSFIQQTVEEMNIPKLRDFGVTHDDLNKITSTTENKSNPIALSNDEMTEILELSLL